MGIGLQATALVLFFWGKAKESKDHDGIKEQLPLIVGMIVIGSTLNFLIKWMASDVPPCHFVVCWYGGVFLFSGLTFAATHNKSACLLPTPKKRVYLLIPLCSFLITCNMAAFYLAIRVNSGTSVISFTAMTGTFLPASVGWIFFGERKASWTEKVGFVFGAVAAVLIVWFH